MEKQTASFEPNTINNFLTDLTENGAPLWSQKHASIRNLLQCSRGKKLAWKKCTSFGR
ncbi:hypothetical protein C5167_004724 [Papaver somniferum]|uniref:Uncharacterized protein n=1 Tax=Papaver somniferum TaxID=3469 RepID=A0A4Y7JCF4_PAPSO|nr:hypothetical protein C5167_004724 [Papaver somniferum]